MIKRPNRRVSWLIAVAALLAVATAVDYAFIPEEPVSSRPAAGSVPKQADSPSSRSAAGSVPKQADSPPKQAEAPKRPDSPKQANSPGRADASKQPDSPKRTDAPKQPARADIRKANVPQTVQALRERLAYLDAVGRSAAEVRKSYVEVAIPYSEAMALLPTYFNAGTDPKAALEAAVRGLAGQAGLAVDALMVAVPQRVGPGVYEGIATITVRGGDSEAMLRFFAEAGRPGNGMAWNGFQLSADAQNQQLSLSGDLRVLLVESAE